jgi:hypothetical protein
MKYETDCNLMRSYLGISKLMTIALLILPNYTSAIENKPEGFSCISWLYNLDKLDSKKEILVKDFFKSRTALAIKFYDLNPTVLENREKIAQMSKPNMEACSKVSYLGNKEDLIVLERVVNFIRSGGDILDSIKSCIKATVILAHAGDQLKNKSFEKESLNLSSSIIRTVRNLNQNLISMETTKEIFSKSVKEPVHKFDKNNNFFETSEFKKIKKSCDVFDY